MWRLYFLTVSVLNREVPMFDRPLLKQPFSSVRRIKNLPPSHVPHEKAFHTVGQAAAVRFFDPYSEDDLQAMRDIMAGKGVKRWMDQPTISRSAYRDWAGTKSNSSFLFAALDSRAPTLEEMEYVRGFVYLYSEREEKFRVKRLEKQGYLEPTRGTRYALEVSFAARPLPDGMQSGSGLMSSALRQSCMQVQALLRDVSQPEVVIFAFTDQDNIAAQRTMESSGFIRQGLMKYDWDSPEESYLYILSWRNLHKKIREKILETLQAST
jgi:hypothetical protein